MIRALLAALALSACATTPAPTVATKAALAVELAYQAAGEAILAADTAGVVPASARPCIAALDTKAYAAVQIARVGHDRDVTAIPKARAAIGDLLARKGC